MRLNAATLNKAYLGGDRTGPFAMTDTQTGLILVYSRTGYTARAAERLAAVTGADVFDWSVEGYGLGGFAIFRGMIGVLTGACPAPSAGVPSLAHRPWVVVCGSVWAGQPAPPLRGMLVECCQHPDLPVGLLLTCGDSKPPVAAKRCAAILGRAFIATAHIPNELDGSVKMAARLDALGAAMQAAAPVSKPA